ncbi:hypothetical protein FHR90_003347 [Endobacter medicaginis]|nr:hypothetical protein [Endobacter medicaginis]MBB3175491.1 hypothetical protein [Endobacter medicaginis]MCX5476718.1 hypothetical protein [Endobacter medicaginis]
MTDAELTVHESRLDFPALKAAAEALFAARDAAAADSATAVRHMRTAAAEMTRAEAAMGVDGQGGVHDEMCAEYGARYLR